MQKKATFIPRVVCTCLLVLFVLQAFLQAFAAYNTVPTKKYPTLDAVDMQVTPNTDDSSHANVEIHLLFSNNVGAIDEIQENRYDMTGYNTQNLAKFHLVVRDKDGAEAEVPFRVTPHPEAAKHQDTSKYFYVYADNLDVDTQYILKIDEDLYANMGNSLGVPYEVAFHPKADDIAFSSIGDLPQTDITVALFFMEASIANNARNADPHADITLTFSNNIAGSDVLAYNAACIYLVKDKEYLPITVRAGDEVQQLIVHPKNPLEYDTEYRIVVVKELMARNGSTLSSPVNLYFSTKPLNPSEETENIDEQEQNTDTLYFCDLQRHWAAADINYLADLGIVTGNPDGRFVPENSITRAETVTILVRSLNLTEQGSGGTFDDIGSHWAKSYISIAASNGIVNGKRGDSFAPDDSLTREELAVMLTRVGELTQNEQEAVTFRDANVISMWALDSVAAAAANHILSGYEDGSFRPQQNVTRAEACRMIANFLKLRVTQTAVDDAQLGEMQTEET